MVRPAHRTHPVDHSSTAGEVARGAYVGGRGRLKVEVFDPPQGDTRLKVTDATQGRVSKKTGKPVGKPIIRIDRGHKGAPHPHVNVENMPRSVKALERLNHTRIPEVPTGVLRVAKHGGKALLVVGAVADVIDLKQSYAADQRRGDGEMTETKRAVGRVAGGWGGAAAGAAAGAAIGSVVPVVGTAVGAVVGGIAGSVGGSWIGESIADWF